MPICLPQQCLALVYGLPPPGDPLFRESPGWWVRLQSVGNQQTHRRSSISNPPSKIGELKLTVPSTPRLQLKGGYNSRGGSFHSYLLMTPKMSLLCSRCPPKWCLTPVWSVALRVDAFLLRVGVNESL